jgi:hypothetical protein
VVTAVDTNVLSTLLFGKQSELEEVKSLLKQCHKEGEVVICPIVFAELVAAPRVNEQLIDTFLRDIFVRVEWTLHEAVWRQAARAYQSYANSRRKQPGDTGPRRIMADFVVGAHATLHAEQLLTFDKRLFNSAFPKLKLL